MVGLGGAVAVGLGGEPGLLGGKPLEEPLGGLA